MQIPSHEKIVELVQAATHALFETMLGTPVESKPDYRTSVVKDLEESVFCMIGFSGDFIGSGSLHCTSTCARKFAAGLLMAEYETVDADVLDAVAEVTNMIVGNFKTSLEESQSVIGISTPTVIYGQNYSARNFGAADWTVVPFSFDGEEFDVRISLQRDREIEKRIERYQQRAGVVA